MAGSPDWDAIRGQFPGLSENINDRPMVYLDTGATAQKPQSVLDAMDNFARYQYGTVHRGLYRRSATSTQKYEEARQTIARFLNAPSERNIVFCGGTTDAINLVANSWATTHLKPGDQILISEMEHHANIVPWQLIRERTGCELVACPILDNGALDMEAFDRLLSERVKLVSIMHVSNALGTINPVKELASKAHAVGAKFLCDGAQSAPHMPVDVQALDCDFYVFSGHKVYGPTGIGILYGTDEVLNSMPPWRGGGDMIDRVSIAETTFAEPPMRFEAGTPAIVEAIGLAAACEWMESIGRQHIEAREHELFAYAEELLAAVPGLTRIGQAPQRSSSLSFVMNGAHASDIASILDMDGVAVRAGHHCAQPVMDRYNVPATARITLGIYTNRYDLERAQEALLKVSELFA